MYFLEKVPFPTNVLFIIYNLDPLLAHYTRFSSSSIKSSQPNGGIKGKVGEPQFSHLI